MLSKREYEDSLTVQDACNLSGVVHSFSKIIKEIWEEAHAIGQGTEWVNKHPISVLFASKIASLTGCEDFNVFYKAYETIKEKTEQIEV